MTLIGILTSLAGWKGPESICHTMMEAEYGLPYPRTWVEILHCKLLSTVAFTTASHARTLRYEEQSNAIAK